MFVDLKRLKLERAEIETNKYFSKRTLTPPNLPSRFGSPTLFSFISCSLARVALKQHEFELVEVVFKGRLGCDPTVLH